MTREPDNRRFNAEELALLADIFRVILREIRTVDDRDKLAPGELGIDYKRGELWIRNPYTGKLFSPNNAERLKLLGRKILPGTTLFDADLVHGISFYTDLIELDKLQEAFTPDSVIRQMHAPAMLFAKVSYDNFKGFGWPAASGMCLCLKSHEEAVIIRYFADKTGLVYEGQYNSEKHLFEGWKLPNGNEDDVFTETEGGGEHVEITVPGGFHDFQVVYVTVEQTISPGAGISVNGTPERPIIQVDGKPLATEIIENTSIMLVYDAVKDAWVYLDRTETALVAIMKLVLERVADTSGKNDSANVQLKQDVYDRMMNTESRINAAVEQLREQHDHEMAAMKGDYEGRINQIVNGNNALILALTKRVEELEKFKRSIIITDIK